MFYETLAYKKRDHIATIGINLHRKDNVEMAQLVGELYDICAEINLDKDVRIIILAGTGKRPFSMERESTAYALKVGERSGKKLWSVAEPVTRVGHPVIAAIRGDAMGQGLELALACDLRIATKTAHFGLPQITKELIPWDGGTQRLSRVVGRGKAMEMILTGETIDAQEAHRVGIVHRVVPDGELLTVVMDMAREIATKSTIAVRYAKEAISKGMDLTLEQGLRLEADLYFLLHTTRDRTEGIRAFQEKREAQFEGK